MLLRFALIATSLAGAMAATASPPPAIPWEGYLDDDGYVARLDKILAGNSERVRLERYGTSREGRPLQAIILASDPERAHERPTLLVVGGLDALHPAGTEYSVRMAERILADHAGILEDVTVVLMPRANPDGIAALMDGINDGRRGGLRSVDADRDGLLDEDQPRDLDGDGVITMMRLADPPLAHPPPHVADPGEPRMMRTPDVAAGERATHAMFVEGIDVDGDGMIGEDGRDDVRIDRNFMHLFVEHDTDSGPYQLSEPESLALAEWVLERPRIFGAVVFGPHDWIVTLPDASKKDVTGRTPIGIDGGDKRQYERLSELWKEHAGQVRSTDEDDRGGLHAWLYAHRGIPTVATTGWGRPDPTPQEDGSSREAPEDPDATERPKPRDAEGAAWLAWSDADRDGTGFVEWREFDHPQLGRIEIGGPVPGFDRNPPAAMLDELAAGHASFLAAMSAMRPRVVVEGPEVEWLGGGVARIRMALRNDGEMPLRTAMARTNRAIRPLVVRPRVPVERILQGSSFELVDRLDPGQRRDFEWVVRVPEDGIVMEVDDPGDRVRRYRASTAEEGAER
ncbi:MAG: hypothetical protein CMJ34_08175 [Phycisphaerae bacterium]|nr:hypothetical protein [Phycisphaerae bacterium]